MAVAAERALNLIETHQHARAVQACDREAAIEEPYKNLTQCAITVASPARFLSAPTAKSPSIARIVLMHRGVRTPHSREIRP
jgi:hypothetical protein